MKEYSNSFKQELLFIIYDFSKRETVCGEEHNSSKNKIILFNINYNFNCKEA